jgi:hypothetical protein
MACMCTPNVYFMSCMQHSGMHWQLQPGNCSYQLASYCNVTDRHPLLLLLQHSRELST